MVAASVAWWAVLLVGLLAEKMVVRLAALLVVWMVE